MQSREDDEVLMDEFLDLEAWDTRPLSAEERAALARGIAAFASAPHEVGAGRQRLSGTIESTARDRPRPWPPATKPPSAG